MRPSSLKSLFALALLLTALRGQATFAGPRVLANQAAAQTNEPRVGARLLSAQAVASNENWQTVFSWDGSAIATSEKDARESVLAKAKAELRGFLRQQNPPITWEPSDEYIKQKLMSEPECKRLEREVDGQPIWEASGLLRVKRSQYQDFVVQDRIVRAQRRQQAGLLFLGGLVVLLGAVGAYTRINEATQGTYVGWLRLAIVSSLGIAGAGWWLIRDRW